MKKKRSVLHDLLFVSISSFIVVAAWIGFNIYHTWVTTTITPEMQIQITAITPDFDTVTLEKLKSRKQVTPITTLKAKPIVESDIVRSPTTTPPIGTPAPAGTSTVTPAPAAGETSLPQSKQTDIPITVQGE